jgi:predicted nucleic acid-binding protein
MAGLTLGTGALIGFERFDRRVLAHLRNAQLQGQELTVPTPVVAEAWRGGARSARIARLLAACVVEPLFEDLARVAGEAIAAVKRASVVDAIVMGSAASRRDRVLTSDFDDLERLRAYFPEVRLLRVQRERAKQRPVGSGVV